MHGSGGPGTRPLNRRRRDAPDEPAPPSPIAAKPPRAHTLGGRHGMPPAEVPADRLQPGIPGVDGFPVKLTYLGHAALMAEAGGRRLLMDPWLEDPGYLGAWWHFPPLAQGLEDLGPVDYVYCSHDHPDHFDPKTLRRLPRSTRFLVPRFTSAVLERRYAELGFTNLIPLEFGRTLELEGGMRVTCYRTDLVWEDSALVVEADGAALFDQNDCKLGDEKLAEIAGRHAIDIAFLPFSGAIQFPTCYTMPEKRKRALCAERRRGHLESLARRVQRLRPRHVVPFAGNFCLPAPDQLWMNEINNINTPGDAVEWLAREVPEAVALQMNPGDTWSPALGLERLRPAPRWEDRLRLVEQLAAQWAPRIEAYRAAERPARATLRTEARAYFARLAAQHAELPGRIDATVIVEVSGPQGDVFTLRYARSGLEIADGAASEWSMRMTVPDTILQQLVDGDVSWDEALISFRLWFDENPEFFNEPFWAMLYSPGPEFMQEYLRFDRPPAPACAGEGA